jgi:radical SAM protein with 4Fe4S-binding SPASM domain
MAKYIILNNHLSIKGEGKEVYLYDITNGKKYLLNLHQIRILKNLDGTHTIKEISKKSRIKEKLISKFLENLSKLKMIRYLNYKLRNPRKDIINFSKKPRLKRIHWEITSRCNLRCLHCYQVSYLYKHDEIPFKYVKITIDELVKLGTEQVSISGGEPFLRRDLFKILNYFERKNIRISFIFTNGLLLTKRVLNKLKLLKSRPTLCISLDGIDPKSMILRGFEKFHIQQKFLNRLIKNIKLAHTMDFPIRINTILNNYNIESLKEMYEFLNRELKGIFWNIGFPRLLGSCVYNKEKLVVSYEKVFKICEELIKKHLWYLSKNKTTIDLKIQYFFHKKFLHNLDYFHPDLFVCNYEDMNASCCIKPNGDVFPCPVLLAFKIGNILKESISKIWRSNKMRKIKEMKIKNLTACRKCKYLPLCGGGCRASAYINCRDLSKEDPLACKAMEYFEKHIKPLLSKFARINCAI